MLTVCTWLWGNKYGPEDVVKLAAGVRRHLKQEYRFICFSEEDRSVEEYDQFEPLHELQLWSILKEDTHLLQHKGCFVRLRMFDPEWQHRRKAKEGDRIVCMDLDTVITGPLDPLFNRPETFMILQGANAVNPCPFNGSLMMLRAGAHPEVWTDFSLDKAKAVPFYEFPDDQGWLHHKLPNAPGWKVGPQSGVYAFQKPGWPKGDDLPSDARLVVFPGWRSPEKFKHLSWIKEHWQ